MKIFKIKNEAVPAEALFLQQFQSMALICFIILGFIASHTCRAADGTIPTFKIRARITEGQDGAASDKPFRFSFKWAGTDVSNVSTSTNNWSDWIVSDRTVIHKLSGGMARPSPDYPAPFFLTYFHVEGVVDPTKIEAELIFDETPGKTFRFSAELFDPRWGIAIRRDENGKPVAQTMSDYNQRYWSALQKISIPEADRPKKFVIADAFFGDGEKGNWRKGLSALSGLGINTLMISAAIKPTRQILTDAGFNRIAGSVGTPHGAWHDFMPMVGDDPTDHSPAALKTWAQNQVKIYTSLGFTPQQVVSFALFDEGAFYYGNSTTRSGVVEKLKESPAALDRFREYLRKQGLTPQDLGQSSWETVMPVNRGAQSGHLAQRRLFYWTCRFLSWDSARYMAAKTAALEEAFYPGFWVYGNWHTFAGRLYSPGPGVWYWDGDWNAESAIGSHDWFEYARLRGGTMLWSEDWFADSNAPHWSYLSSRLNAAAKKANLKFGSYIVARVSGKDILKKALALVGHGGKEIFYYMFGPGYVFADGYSDKGLANPALFEKIAEANQLIGRAEDLLWPGETPASKIAILYPRSAQLWDRYDPKDGNHRVYDQMNWNVNYNVDYMAEMRGLFHAFQNSGIGVEFIEEDDLNAATLAKYKVIYITEPNIPPEGQSALVQWTQSGGTLAKISNSGTADHYNERTSKLSTLGGIEEAGRERFYTGPEPFLQGPITTISDTANGKAEVRGVRGKVTRSNGNVEAKFSDGTPAVLTAPAGSGRVVHFAFLPGFSYHYSATEKEEKIIPVSGFSDVLRRLIIRPVEIAGVKPVVQLNQTMVEAPMLVSTNGVAITLLNWSNSAKNNLQLTVQIPFPVGSVSSVSQGNLTFTESNPGSVDITLPTLKSVDILKIYPKANPSNPLPDSKKAKS